MEPIKPINQSYMHSRISNSSLLTCCFCGSSNIEFHRMVKWT